MIRRLIRLFRRPRQAGVIEIPNPWAYCGGYRVVLIRKVK